MKLNLGSGKDHRAGWLNADSMAEWRPDVVCDVRALPLKTGVCSEVLLKHVLEHVPHKEVPGVLREVRRIMHTGAKLTIDGPNLRGQCLFLASETNMTDEAILMLFGGQTTRGDYHHTGFDIERLNHMLTEAGFEVVWSKDFGLTMQHRARARRAQLLIVHGDAAPV